MMSSPHDAAAHPAAARISCPLGRVRWLSVTTAVVATVAAGSLGCSTTTAAKGSAKGKVSAATVLAERDAAANRLVEPQQIPPAGTVVIAGATVMTAAGDVFAPGHVVLQRGKVVAVAQGEPGKTPDGAVVVNAKGKYVTPGIIDAHSHLGVYPSPWSQAHSDGNEATNPTTARVWAEHSFWPQDPGIQTAVAGGVTTIHVLPGSANLIGGRSVTLSLIGHRGSRAMKFPQAPGAVKMACGENPKRVYGQFRKRAPSTRMGNVAGHRAAFAKAKEYIRQLDKKGHETPRNLEMETLAGVLLGRYLPQVHCYRADDILAFLQVADEFGFKVRTFHHGLEAYKVRDVLKKKDIAVATWTDWWGYKLEMYDGIPYNIPLLHESGVRAVLHSDSSQDIQRLNQEAGKAQKYAREAGMKVTDDEALQWITSNPAWSIGIGERVGTLEVGKIGDVVVWSGHPFSVYSSAERVYIQGHLVYDASKIGTKRWSDFELGQDIGVTP